MASTPALHLIAQVAALWNRFNKMLQPFVDANKMGVVLVQLHLNFGQTDDNAVMISLVLRVWAAACVHVRDG